MSYWGKVLGGMAGFAMGGPFGAMVGMAMGHAADTGNLPNAPRIGFSTFTDPMAQAAAFARITGQRDQVLSMGAVILAAKLAKADGPVKRVEIDAFKRHFRIPPAAVRDVGRLFDHARDADLDTGRVAAQMGEIFADSPEMLETVLAALYGIARADGPVNRAEEAVLSRITLAFRLNANARERAETGRTAAADAGEPDPYAILGVPKTASDDDIRASWKQLVRKHHPDALASRGEPPERVKRATETVARVNAAWDRIKRQRGI
jgi:DnaJ like chaperone protein